MFTATLLTVPDRPIDAALVESLRNAWGGGPIRRLGPDAAEFDMPGDPSNRDAVWGDLQAQDVDLVVQPTEGRRKAMLLADMDSTMIAQECIDELADEAGVGAHVARITARAMNGEIGFEGALEERVALLEGLDFSAILKVRDTRLTFTPGGRVLLATMKAHGARAVLVSGGFTAFTEWVAGELGFDEHRANVLEVRGHTLTGRVRKPYLGREAKVQALEEITAARGLTPADVLCVGDGANDLGMIQRAGTGVALHAKPVVQAQARVRINHGDLTALLYLQGYDRAAFVGA